MSKPKSKYWRTLRTMSSGATCAGMTRHRNDKASGPGRPGQTGLEKATAEARQMLRDSNVRSVAVQEVEEVIVTETNIPRE